jgi:hypothetical protein
MLCLATYFRFSESACRTSTYLDILTGAQALSLVAFSLSDHSQDPHKLASRIRVDMFFDSKIPVYEGGQISAV